MYRSKIKKFFHEPYFAIGNYLMMHCPKVMSDEYYLKVRWKKWMGYELNIRFPHKLNEKLQWLKLYDHNPLYTRLADKHEMKRVVKGLSIPGVEPVPTLFIYKRAQDINWADLPQKFVIKCTHDSGSGIFCNDKSSFDTRTASAALAKALKNNYYYKEREWAYKNIKPRIIVEPFLEGDNGSPIVDYKFYIFGGELQYWMYSVGEPSHSGKNLKFSPQKKNIDYLFKERPKMRESDVVFPDNIDEMISAARKIGRDFKHVRIDMYCVNGTIYIGEFTFYSGGGYLSILNEEYAQHLADLIDTTI